jgi:putative hydrolase
MSDNIFDRLAELLSSPGTINWALAEELAASAAGPGQAVPPEQAGRIQGLVRTARLHLEDVPGIGAADRLEVRVLDRRGWATNTVRRYGFIAEPLAAALPQQEEELSLIQGVLPIMIGLQVGSMVGAMSHRLLGDFDASLPPVGGDAISLISANIADFVSDHELDHDQTELWTVAQEVIHSAILSLPGPQQHFQRLISRYMAGLEFNPDALPFDGIDPMTNPEELAARLQEPGALGAMFASESRDEDLAEIRALLAALEGYAVYATTAMARLIPELGRIREAVDRRRASPSQGEQFLQRLLGLDLQPRRYREGAQFFSEVSRRWGPEAISRVWAAEDSTPTAVELDDPVSWAARVLLS